MADSNTQDTPTESFPDSTNNINDGEGLEVADPNDFFHRRDSDDELQPVLQQIPGRDQALRVIPPTTGDYEKYNLGSDAVFDDDALLAELFNEKLVDLDAVTATDIAEGMIMFGAEPLVDCIKRAGGQDMKDALDNREVEQMMELLAQQDGEVDFSSIIKAGQEVNAEEMG